MEVGVESEKSHLDNLVGRFVDVDCSGCWLPSVDRIVRVGAISTLPTGRASVANIYLIIIFYQWTDGVDLTRVVGGDQLGNDINAVVVALAGRECIDFRKPFLGGLIVPFGDTDARGG